MLGKVDLNTLGLGTLIGVIVTSIVTLAGHLIRRSTTIDTARLDDRAKLTTELMEQVERMFEEVGELREAVAISQRRELTFIRLFANLGAELRILNGFLTVNLLALKNEQEDLDREELTQQSEQMRECLEKMQSLIEVENERFNEELKHKEIRPDAGSGKGS